MILLLSSLLHAKPHNASVTASSSFSDEHGSYVAKQLTDNYASKAWVEDEKAVGLGAWIEVKARCITRYQRNRTLEWKLVFLQ